MIKWPHARNNGVMGLVNGRTKGRYRAVACDITGGVAFLNFDATELKIFYGNLGSPSNPNLQYEHFETYH